jgi:hypothetical protein
MSLKSQNVFFDAALLQEHVARFRNDSTAITPTSTPQRNPHRATLLRNSNVYSGVLRNVQQQLGSYSTDSGKYEQSGKMVVNNSGPRMTEGKKPVGIVRLFPN